MKISNKLPLPDEHHVMRMVSHGRLRKDENDAVIGVDYTAFQLRPDEDGLSVTWVEYFSGSPKEQCSRAIRAMRASARKPSPKSGFAVGNVGQIKLACQVFKHKIRIIHAPVDDNKAHSELRQFPRDDRQLLEKLASESWAQLILNKDEPAGDEPAPDKPHVSLVKP